MRLLYYVPPKLKPKKKSTQRPLPEWNSTINDLGKYKLSSSELLKKKINSVSKNLETCKLEFPSEEKKTTQEVSMNRQTVHANDHMLENKTSQNNFKQNVKSKSKQRFSPRHRFEKKENHVLQNKKAKLKEKSKEKIRLLCEEMFTKEEVKDEINLMPQVKINSTKIEKESHDIFDNKQTVSKTSLLEEFDQTLKKMESHIEKNKTFSRDKSHHHHHHFVNNTSKDTFPYNEEKQIESIHNRSEIDYEHNRSDCEDDYENINDSINKKFDNLNEIENCMRKLDGMLENSNKTSMKVKFEREYDNLFSDDNLNHLVKDNREDDIPIVKLSPIREMKEKKQTNSLQVNHSKIIDIDKPRTFLYEDNIKEDDYGDLEYVKILLENTKKDIDILNTKFKSTETTNEQEEEPRTMPLCSKKTDSSFHRILKRNII